MLADMSVMAVRSRTWFFQVTGKNRLPGLGNPRFPARSAFKGRPEQRRRRSTGTTMSAKSSKPPGTEGNITLNPSQAPANSHPSISSAMVPAGEGHRAVAARRTKRGAGPSGRRVLPGR